VLLNITKGIIHIEEEDKCNQERIKFTNKYCNKMENLEEMDKFLDA
jgi:hypothetical protein